MPETPYQRFDYPPKASPTWYKNGEVINVEGADVIQEHDGLVDWLEQIEVTITGQVETVSDLPEPDPEAENQRTGERRVYLVLDEGTLYRDDGTQWSAAMTSSVTIENSGTEVGEVSRFNFRSGLAALLDAGGEEIAIDLADAITPDTVTVGVEFTTPTYTDLASASAAMTEGSGNLVFITGGGTDAAGLYYHDGGGWNILSSGSGGATSLSELAIDGHKDWGGKNILNVGTMEAETVSATSAINVPVHSGSDPAEGNFWIRSDR